MTRTTGDVPPTTSVAASPDTSGGLTVITGREEVLVDRAVDQVVRAARAADPQAEVRALAAGQLTPGELAMLASPSLFATTIVLVVRGVEEAAGAVADELADLSRRAGRDGLWLVLVHAGGAKGRQVLEAARRAGASVVDCPAVRYDSDKVRFVAGEFTAAHRRITSEAVRALVAAVGSDLRELAASCAQLIADTTGAVDVDVVDRYYGGRVEASGFKVADAALEGRAGDALILLRHALATGADPVPVNAALGNGLRTLAKVAAGRRGTPDVVARDLGLAPFQVKKARAQLAGWTAPRLAAALETVAWADAQIKGGGADPRYALERAVLTIAGGVQETGS